MRHVEWNKVTWYSRLLAAGLFVALPFLGFYFGFLYGKGAAGVEIVAVRAPQAGTASSETQAAQENFASAQTTTAAPEHALALSYPYPVSWQGVNGAVITLTNISVGNATGNQGKQFYALTLTLNAAAGFGEFCTSAFGSYELRKVADEAGNTIAPSVFDDNCAPSHSTLYAQRVSFPASEDEKTFTISVYNPDNTQQTFFIVRIMNDGTLQLEPAPTQG